ncbi:MAG: alanine/glycine:cation symporter family protein [Brevinema sp.]
MIINTETLTVIINNMNDFLYTYILVFLLCGAGIYFTIITKGIQFHLKSMFRYLVNEEDLSTKNQKSISSFQAFAVSTASRVGTGNLAGVTLAVVIGGPGALFWMWVTALLGGALSFAECTLAQIYKVSNYDTRKSASFFKGGPAYYISQGLSLEWLAKIFTVILIFVFGFSFNAVQSNTIAQSFESTFSIPPFWVGIFLASITGVFIFKGLPTIAKVSAILVPIMSLFYIGLSFIIIMLNIEKLPEVMKMIFEDAFGFKQIGVGTGVGTIITGIKRGLFSNEAGIGSAPNVAASATTSHPVKQGLIQAFGVFFDTILICSTTGFLILFSGVQISDPNISGITLTQLALTKYFGVSGAIFLSICILLLAFSSILGNYFYALNSVSFISKKYSVEFLFKILVIFNVFLGAISSLEMVWSIADFVMFFMTLINLFAIIKLSKILTIVLKDYNIQKKENKNPIFKKEKWINIYPDLFSKLDQWS